jgi:hypothetical protein
LPCMRDEFFDLRLDVQGRAPEGRASMPAPLRCRVLSGQSLRNQSSQDMPFPHPQSRKDHSRKEDIPSWGGIVWEFFKRTINITEYRNTKDDVNPAKNRTLGGIFHD